MIGLTRPLVSIDLETTGTNLDTDRIVEIAAVKLYLDGRREIRSTLVNPGRVIPLEAKQIHGIDDASVQGSPTFRQLSKSLAEFLEGCDVAGYNVVGFDIPMLTVEFERCGIEWPAPDVRVVDAYRLWVRQETRKLEDAVREFCGGNIVLLEGLVLSAHRAEFDAGAALDVLEAQVKRYFDPDRALVELHEIEDLCFDPDWLDREGKFRINGDGEVVCAFGKHKGTPLTGLEYGFLCWVLKKDFSPQVKSLVRGELDRRRADDSSGAPGTQTGLPL